MESGRALDFGQVNTDDAGFLSDTVVITFNLGEVNSNIDSFFNEMVSASSVATNFKAFNMKFWQGNLSAFVDVSGIPKPTFHYFTSPTWSRGLQIIPGDSNVFILPSSLPTSGNIFNNTNVFISGAYKNAEFSDFIYLRGQFPSGNYTLGTYGGLGVRTFTFRLTYDYSNINANILETDLLPC
jgi:hypothetical protein